jgi:hypothetical protein
VPQEKCYYLNFIFNFSINTMIIKYTYIDVITKRPVSVEPAAHGPMSPDIEDSEGFEFLLANESEWPCAVPLFYSRCSDTVAEDTAGILAVLTEEEFEEVRAAEMQKREGSLLLRAKQQRDHLLTASDWTQLGDVPLTAEVVAEFRLYRQALRDLPAQEGFPDVVWPTNPFAPAIVL